MTCEDNYRRAWSVLVGGVMLVWCASATLKAQSPPGRYAPTDIQYGSRIFSAHCVVCHGVTGDLVANVDLRSGMFRRAATDYELRALLTSGIPGTAMQPFKFDDSELTMIVAYLRNMRDFNARAVPVGDAIRGRGVFEGAGACATCHRVNGKGPRVAPDLSNVGTLRSAEALQRSIIDPSSSTTLPMNRSVRAVTRDGQVIAGRRLNEDTFTVQLIDEGEQLVSLVKSDLKDYQVIRASSMPSYKDKLNSEDLADVVAYLLTLKGR
jgi:putative heme-binding domain-containing protein